MIYIIEIVLWIVGFIISQGVYRLINSLCDKNKGVLDDTYIAEIKEQNETTKKHFFITGIYFPIVIILSCLLPWRTFKWLLFFGCGFTVPPVFYDVFYNNLKRTFENKERFLFSFVSIYNFLIMALSMFTHYFAYIHMNFS